MALIIPKEYKLKLLPETTEQSIKLVKMKFQDRLAETLNLRRVTAPLFVLAGTGLNDDLNGTERAVNFPVKCMDDRRAEVVHSLAKWKRMKLGAYGISPGFGLYTDMNAIRADEDLDNLHSLYVDQWDWEQSINASDRKISVLKETVKKIYSVIKELEDYVYKLHPHITPNLPENITFIQSEELLQLYPDLTPKERETEITKKYGAVFIIGIGADLSNGEKHDGRAPDYDDWTTETEGGYKGLNGDIMLWNPILDLAFEISSMGIRVDRESLNRQLEIAGCQDRSELEFHKSLLEEKLPLSIGGGIGQSRLCMFLLQKAHIGEVQASIWPEEQIKTCALHNIHLL